MRATVRQLVLFLSLLFNFIVLICYLRNGTTQLNVFFNIPAFERMVNLHDYAEVADENEGYRAFLNLLNTQQCKIPSLDPFHKALLGYFIRENVTSCNMKKFARVSGGKLHLKLNEIQSAGIYYLRRFADIWTTKSEYHSLTPNVEGMPGCIYKKKGGVPIQLKEDFLTAVKYAVLFNSTGGVCTKENMFVITNNKILQKHSQRCLIPQMCVDEDPGCRKRSRQGECDSNSRYMMNNCKQSCNVCDVWKQKKTKGFVSCGGYGRFYNQRVKAPDCGSCPGGPTWCGGDCSWCKTQCQPKGLSCNSKEETLIKLSSSALSAECSEHSFMIDEEYRIKHMESGKCICESSKNRYLVLGPCNDATDLLSIPYDMIPKADVDITYHLKEDMVKLVLVHNRRSYTEYHLTAVKTEEKKRQPHEQNISQSIMNIVLINFDSQSHANIQRQWSKTYEYLTKDPDSVILKGLVINGDATTANLTPLLTGYATKDLPEARYWLKGSGSLDRWPFIFKDVHWANYKTAYMEDVPSIGAFYYRLSGFKEQPTDKYLLPWFSAEAMDKSNHEAKDCTQKVTLNYLKEFLSIYHDDKKFALALLGKIGHGYMNQMHMADEDMMDFFQFISDSSFRDNTTVIVFGDHGSRSGAFRATMQGKLEERLPFLSISFPPWFKEKHSLKMKHLEQNSEVLTSWFDIHQTIRHLIWPGNYTNNRLVGKSLFTDVVSLNRTCDQVGIPVHYCPCLVARELLKDDKNVVRVAQFVIKYINEMINNVTKAAQLCSRVEYDKVLRAKTIGSNKQVETFVRTHETSECDDCGAELGGKVTLNVVTYEVLVRVKNFGGLFEATVEVWESKGAERSMRLSGDISRINRYGDQPMCVATEYPTLRKFCFCKDYGLSN